MTIAALLTLFSTDVFAVRTAPISDHSRDYYGTPDGQPAPRSIANSIRSASDGYSVTVRRGDSVSKIAMRYGVETEDVIKSNNLKAPYVVHVGQKLKLSPTRTHTVQRGDTLSKIARRYNVEMKELAALNNIRAPYTLHLGEKIKLPYGAMPASLDKKRTITYVAKNETPAKPKKTQPSTRTKQDPDGIRVYLADKPAYRTGHITDRNIVNASYTQHSVPTVTTALFYDDSRGKKVGNHSTRSRFIWPTTGKLLSSYGSKKSGIKNDGINISASEGAPIKAAADGVVVYVGSELKGYGNLIIMRHDGGWMTAYAHQSRFAVRKGAKVSKGQTIGYVGSTGNVDRPQLHFAIRKGRKAVNPTQYLPS